MAWGQVELEPEVSEWLEGLDDQRWAAGNVHLDLLEDLGILLGEPFTRQLSGKLRKLRFTAAGNGSASRTGRAGTPDHHADRVHQDQDA